jgi:hypothetical protein
MAIKLVETPGWDAGARTIDSFPNNGAFQFRVGQAIGIICGLNDRDNGAGYAEIDHAFLIQTGTYQIIERGVLKTASAVCSPTATFRIIRIREVVRYYIDGALVYTSEQRSTGEVFGDCSLYAYLDTISDAEITDYGLVDPTRASEYNFGDINLGLSVFGTDLADGNFGNIDLGLTASGTGTALNRGDIDLGLTVFGSDLTDTNFGSIDLGLTASGSDLTEIRPEYNAGNIDLGLEVYGVSGRLDTNEGNIDLGLAARGSDVANYGVIDLGLTVLGLEGYKNILVVEWYDWSVSMDLVSRLDVMFDWPAFTGEAFISTGDNNALFQWPAFTGESYTGATAEFNWPAIEGEAVVTNPNFATALFGWPAFDGEATAFTGQTARATFDWPTFQGEAFSGTSASFAWPTFEGDASVTVGSVASALFDWPAFAGESAVTSQGVMSALFDWPAFEGEAGDGTRVVFDWPAFTGSATITHAVVTADAEAYAINLTTGAMTRLLLGPLDKLVTAHGKLYVLRNGELLVLAGDVDGVSTAIPATARLAQQNFGVLNAKRCSEVYMDTRENDGVTLDLIQDESTAWRYQTPTDTAPAMGTHKVSTGRGIKFHTLGVIIKNRAGGRLDIGGIELRIQPLSRRPKT